MNQKMTRWLALGWGLVLGWSVLTLHVKAQNYTNVDVGSPTSVGSTVFGEGKIRLESGGSDIGSSADYCQYYYRDLAGDFDVQVRVKSLVGGDLWAKAGIMARTSLEAASPQVSVLATPNLVGCLMLSRPSENATATSVSGFPPATPYLWLRLQRTNGVFTGYAGVDGQVWYPINTLSNTTIEPIYLGLAVSSHATNSAAAVFSDFGNVTNTEVSAQPFPQEWPGPSTRRTGLVISEIMYKPAEQADGKNLEFVEVFNSNPFFEDISGYQLDGSISYTFPKDTILPGGGYLVVAKAPSDLRAHYGLATVLGPYNQKLPAKGTVRLLNAVGAVFLDIDYSDIAPWPLAADGAGHSIVLARPSLGAGNVAAWDASYAKGGSPGLPDAPRLGAWQEIVLNEFHGGDGSQGFVELFNRRHAPLDISGAWLSDDSATNKFQIPPGTIIPARGWVAFTSAQLGFPLPLAGADIYFSSPDQSRVVQATHFDAHLVGMSCGRYPDGALELSVLAAPTPATTNSAPHVAEVVINEIMYHPISRDDDGQYIELYNPGSQSVDLGGWKFVAGIDFTFPAGKTIAAGGYLVVARNAARLQTNYAQLNAGNLVGDFAGKLSHSGERLALARPLAVAGATNYAVVDEVTYGTGGRWGKWSDGGGSSLELIDARADHRRATSWADSDETKKASWTPIGKSGLFNYGYISADSLQLMLLGAGECLVDNVEVRLSTNGVNLVANPNFEGGLDNWVVLGNHVRSTLETTEGYQSSQSLHVRASDHGDTGANRIRVKLNNPSRITYETNGTIRAKVRWLRGSPDFLLRIKGNYLEAYTELTVPNNLGTPGLPNSCAVANAGPSVTEVTHYPALPAASQPVVVSARVSDPDGLGAVTLNYRIDPATEYSQVPMVDTGADGDAIAGDGMFSATIPGQPGGKLVAFYLTAVDRNSTAATTIFPNDAPTRECLVRFGDPITASPFGTYRFWMTAATQAKWIARPVLSNEELDGTFIYGNQRVVYNASARYSGSPFHQSISSPVSGQCTYAMSMPADDQVLGTTSFNKLHAPGNSPGDDATIQSEQTAYWMVRQMGLPWNYQRYFHMYVNGVRRSSLMEDTQVPGPEVLEANFPGNTDGNLYKMSGYFEFGDAKTGAMNMQAQEWCTLNVQTTRDGEPDSGKYRWNWQPRATQGRVNEFAMVDTLARAASGYDGNYPSTFAALADVDQWIRTFAIEHVVGNWDSFGFTSGQNMYAYKPKNDPWKLLIWDFNIVLANGSADRATANNLFNYISWDSGLNLLYSYPNYMRKYLREISNIAQGPAMDSEKLNALVDARYAAIRAAGLNVGQPTSIKNYVATRRNSLLSMVAKYDAGFKLTGQATNDFATDQNWIYLTGTAPLSTETIEINGVSYPVTWSSTTNWTVRLALDSAESHFIIRALDAAGNLVPGAASAVTVTYTGTTGTPDGRVVINEIMYHPAVADAEYIELYNTSTQGAFDLSNYRLDGLDYTFPGGSWIEPGGYLVLARDKAAFAQAYGSSINVFGTYSGHLDNAGETLQLVRPGLTVLGDTVIDEVTYSSQWPWPQAADGSGASLQLIDPALPHNSPASWAAIEPASGGQSDWRQVMVSGTANATNANLLLYHSPYQAPHDVLDVAGTWNGGIDFSGQSYPLTILFFRTNNTWGARYVYTGGGLDLVVSEVSTNHINFMFPTNYGDVRWNGVLSADGNKITGILYESYQETNNFNYPFHLNRTDSAGNVYGGDLYLDDLRLVAGTQAGVGDNLVVDGDFETPLADAWHVASNHQETSLAATNLYSGTNSLHLVASAGGRDEETAVWQTVSGLVPGQTYTLSFWYLPSTNGQDLTVRLGDSSVATVQRFLPQVALTPGAANAVWIDKNILLPVALTEVQPENVSGIQDAQGHRAPWVELYNSSTNSVSLAGCWLASQTTNLVEWAFPADAAIAAGQYAIVWLDGATNETTASEWHASFTAAPTNGLVVLSHRLNGQLAVLDSLAYHGVATGQSFGVQASGAKSVQPQPTPGQVNVESPTVNPIVINEWMADNSRTLADAADGQFKDWFELYNPNDQSVVLTGYSLTDDLTNPAQFVIPSGYSIPAQGYLLVWADSDPKLNTPGQTALHVNFKLAKAGDTIALFAPDGSLVDSVVFGQQAADISQGRDTQGGWAYMDTPTPGAKNIIPGSNVADRFQITAIVVEQHGMPLIMWNSVPGLTYQVQFKDSLAADWANLGSPIVATDDYATVYADHSTTGSQRFYQVVLQK